MSVYIYLIKEKCGTWCPLSQPLLRENITAHTRNTSANSVVRQGSFVSSSRLLKIPLQNLPFAHQPVRSRFLQLCEVISSHNKGCNIEKSSEKCLRTKPKPCLIVVQRWSNRARFLFMASSNSISPWIIRCSFNFVGFKLELQRFFATRQACCLINAAYIHL